LIKFLLATQLDGLLIAGTPLFKML
jgi:hypothetical protein